MSFALLVEVIKMQLNHYSLIIKHIKKWSHYSAGLAMRDYVFFNIGLPTLKINLRFNH
jgi:hypothetical protein